MSHEGREGHEEQELFQRLEEMAGAAGDKTTTDPIESHLVPGADLPG